MRLLLQSYLQISRRAGDPSHCISESFSFKRKKDSFNIKPTKFGKMKIVFLITLPYSLKSHPKVTGLQNTQGCVEDRGLCFSSIMSRAEKHI